MLTKSGKVISFLIIVLVITALVFTVVVMSNRTLTTETPKPIERQVVKLPPR